MTEPKRDIEYWMKHPGYECLAGEPMEVTQEIIRRLSLCQCEACKTVQHASYCAVHNAPALPIGKCTCGSVEVLE